MKIFQQYIVVILAIVLLSCEKDIKFDIQTQSDKLVIYSFIYPDSSFQLHFSKSVNILSLDDYQPVQNAGFKIYKNDELFTEQRLPKDVVWRQWEELKFKEGDKIRIEAFEREGDTVRSETTLINPVPISKIDTSYTTAFSQGNGVIPYKKCKVFLNDPDNTPNYYQLVVVREAWGQDGNDDYNSRNTIQYEKDDKVFSHRDQTTSLLEGVDFQGLFDDHDIKPSYYGLDIRIPNEQFKLWGGEVKARITFYLYHHTFDYYNYFRSRIISQEFYGLPFFDPIKIHNNIDGGLGLFSGMAFYSDSILISQ